MRNLNLNSTDPENASGQGEFRGAVRNLNRRKYENKNILETFLGRRERYGSCRGYSDHCGTDRACDHFQKIRSLELLTRFLKKLFLRAEVCKKASGQITVFMALCFLVFLGLYLVCLQSVQTQYRKKQAEQAVEAGMFLSVFRI